MKLKKIKIFNSLERLLKIVQPWDDASSNFKKLLRQNFGLLQKRKNVFEASSEPVIESKTGSKINSEKNS